MALQRQDKKAAALISAKKLSVSSRLLGRQPILTSARCLIGHELLFRDSSENRFSGNPESATQQVIENYLRFIPDADQGIAFINCTRETITTRLVTLLPKDSVVLEILENIDADTEVIESCRALKALGYRFALDDFRPEEAKVPFLEFADYIKIDFLASSADERKVIYALGKTCNAQMIAEKIESQADMELARAEGCTLFQGYFFSKPVIVSQARIPQNQVTYLLLLSALAAEQPNLLKIERLFKGDTSLCYLLLRLANSALFAGRAPTNTIGDALMRIGVVEIRKLVTISFSGMFANTHSQALIRIMLERARLCELLSAELHESPGKLYLLGMLSLLDTIMQVPMEKVLKEIPLDVDMTAALIGHPSRIGVALEVARAFESGEWDDCARTCATHALTENQLVVSYARSVQWANGILSNQFI